MVLDIVLTLAAALLGCFLLLRWLMACGLGIPMEESFFMLQPEKHRICQRPGEKMLRRQENGKIFLTALAFRVALLLLSGLILLFLAGEGEPMSLQNAWMRGDSCHYFHLVEEGYSGYIENGEHLFLVFFPLYVWLVRGVNLLIGNTFVSGLTVSFLCYSAACVFVYRLAREELNRRAAQRGSIPVGIPLFIFLWWDDDRKPLPAHYFRVALVYPPPSLVGCGDLGCAGCYDTHARCFAGGRSHRRAAGKQSDSCP